MRDPLDKKKEKQVQRAMEQIPKPICLQITNGCLSPFFCNPMQHETHWGEQTCTEGSLQQKYCRLKGHKGLRK